VLHVESATATDQERLNVANKMADKRKTTGRQTQVTQPRPRTSEKPVKSISDMAHDEQQSVSLDDGKTSSAKTAKSVSTPARDAKDTSVKDTKKSEPVKAAKVASVARNEQRKPRRDSKQPSWLARFRQNRLGNFVYEAYYELRHKVTWPTFEEARNMTFVVVVLSAVIGAFLAAVDYGLYNLFLLISGGK
jgi:preprotein translocase SecE subunit